MGSHKIHVERNGLKWDARCSCRKMMEKPGSPDEAAQWGKDHLELVDRVREHLANRNPPLQSQRDYYLEKANDYHETAENQAVWQRLADELTVRLGEAGTPSDPEPRLF